MNAVDELVGIGERLGRGRGRQSLAFQLREQSVHSIGDGGGKWKRRDKWSASKMAMAAAGWLTVPCRVSKRRLWVWAMHARMMFDMRVSTSLSHHL